MGGSESAGRLAGRRVLVTGAASGIGRSIAEVFAREGAALLLLDRDEAQLAASAAATGGVACKTDVTSEPQVAAAIQMAVRELGGLDGVVNAAGILAGGSLMETPPEVWRRVYEVNLIGPVTVCRHAIPELLKSADATIVNIASMSGLRPSGFAAYGASKAALISVTQSLAKECPTIRSNAICPGGILTPMVTAVAPGLGPRDAEDHSNERLGRPEEVADAALFLSSREASFVNGDALMLDGGHRFR